MTFNEREIRAAGPRYTPVMDPAAPNLKIESTLRAFDGLAANAVLRRTLRSLESEVRKTWNRAPDRLRRAFRVRTNGPDRLCACLLAVAGAEPQSWREPRAALERAVRYTGRRIHTVLNEVQLARFQGEPDDAARRELDSDLAYIHQVRRAVGDVESFLASPGYAAMARNALLLLGTWGTGKTHFLCDLARHRATEEKPTLLVLAHRLRGSVDPGAALAAALDARLTFPELLASLQRLGEESGERALVLVDGINEGDRQAWRSAVGTLSREVARYSHVGLALSCRRPFQEQIFAATDRTLYVEAEHPGFQEVEIDAQLEFFGYFGIPVPQFPLITPEFSNPLFLKILCEAIAGLSQRSQKKSLRDVASGQRGMTHVLEQFARHIGRSIEAEFGLQPLTCWRIMKGDRLSGGTFEGLAPIMASDGPRDYVTHSECLDVIGTLTGLPPAGSRDCLRRMVAEGLLVEDLQWEDVSSGPVEVVRFPYQRFGDHLIARHLLERYLDAHSPETIRRSLYVNRPLGWVFGLMPGGYSFVMTGLASAIMLEFPERVKRVLPAEERELVFYLPRARRLLAPLKDVFLEGLYWRSAAAFTKQTDHLVNLFLHEYNEYVTRETLDILAGLASRPGHPYSASRLWAFLAGLEMPERDLFWSEYLRTAHEGSVVYRLLEWVERRAADTLEDQAARDALRLLALTLTTTDRPLRDRATRALVAVGTRHPVALFDLALESLDFNDPYVPERLLAACYGVAMNDWADPAGGRTREALPEFARRLVDAMFLPDVPHPTRHVLMRDYALGTIQLARRVAPGCVATAKVRYTKPPFDHLPVPFADPGAISEEDVRCAADALHMDFENYTLGRLTPDRRRYDANHPEHQNVRRQILGRMRGLGYSSKRFQSIDRMIAEHGWRARDGEGKVDRYGKKYSWIAYFEMYGVREDRGQIAERLLGDRTPDCDIDPSFPPEPPPWTPPLPDPFGAEEGDPIQWLADGPAPSYDHFLRLDQIDGIDGPWVLLEGFVEQGREGPRRVFTFLRGLLVRPAAVGSLREAVENPTGDRGDDFPEPYSDHYTYAGEIPWSSRFGSGLRGTHGKARRNFQPIFERFESGRWVSGARAEVPSHQFAWESYHSTLNQVSGVLAPAPALCATLGLRNARQTFDLLDARGRQATLYREFKTAPHSTSHLLYLRRDLLERYLAETRQTLAWILWGERMLWPLELLSDDERARLPRHYHVHKRVVTYR